MSKQVFVPIIILLGVVCLLSSCHRDTVDEEQKPDTGWEEAETSGEDLRYTLQENGTYAVSAGDARESTSIIIPAEYRGIPVTTIGEMAFSDRPDLLEITIPPSVTQVAENAFSGCVNVRTATIPAVAIPAIPGFRISCVVINGGTKIPDEAFYGFENLMEITVAPGVTEVGKDAFAGCVNVKTATLPASVVSALPKNSLQILRINGGTRIGKTALSGCYQLRSITLPDSVAEIEDGAFSDCGNLNFTEYEGGKYLGNPENPYLVLVSALGATVTDLAVPDETRLIYAGAFSACDALSRVILPSGIIGIGGNAFEGVDARLQVWYTGSVADWCGITFRNVTSNPAYCGATLYIGGATVERIHIPDTVETIPAYAFCGCMKLAEVEIGEGVRGIGKSSFYYCEALEEIVIPDSVTQIGEMAFCNCTGLSEVILGVGLLEIGAFAFDGCENLSLLTFCCEEGWQICCNVTETATDVSDAEANARNMTTVLYPYVWRRT